VRVDNKTIGAGGTDALVVMTKWKEFWFPDFKHLKAQIIPRVIFYDLR